jgi:hypothetical protein
VPPLYGYVGTSPKQTAQLILETHLGDPLLAVWEYGLGRTAAWTSDATGRWGVDWVDWPGYSTFWTNLVRWTISEDLGGDLETEVRYTGEQANLIVEARDGNERLLNDLQLEAVIVEPDGQTGNVSLQQVGPGRYEAVFAPAAEGAYLIRVASLDTGAGETVGQTGGWVLGYSPEYGRLATDEQLLSSIAELTGGRNLTDQFEQDEYDAVLAHDLPVGEASRPIWPWLLVAAVILLPFDVAVRRIILTTADGRRLWRATLGRFSWSSAPASGRSERVARLFQAKERAARPSQERPKMGTEPDVKADRATTPAQDTSADMGSRAAGAQEEGSMDSGSSAGEEYKSLASRLLERRQSRDADDADEE